VEEEAGGVLNVEVNVTLHVQRLLSLFLQVELVSFWLVFPATILQLLEDATVTNDSPLDSLHAQVRSGCVK